MELNIANCPKCGRVYNPKTGDVCHTCKKEIEADYVKCAEYLRENRGATVFELSEATRVSVRQITKFIRERRISLADAPNLTYPCEACGTMIREGKLCDACYKRLSKTISTVQDRQQERQGDESRRSGYKFKEENK